jgi:hypothetical protein
MALIIFIGIILSLIGSYKASTVFNDNDWSKFFYMALSLSLLIFFIVWIPILGLISYFSSLFKKEKDPNLEVCDNDSKSYKTNALLRKNVKSPKN